MLRRMCGVSCRESALHVARLQFPAYQGADEGRTARVWDCTDGAGLDCRSRSLHHADERHITERAQHCR